MTFTDIHYSSNSDKKLYFFQLQKYTNSLFIYRSLFSTKPQFDLLPSSFKCYSITLLIQTQYFSNSFLAI